MNDAYIIDAIRTPVGRRGGGLSHVHPADLGAHAIKGLLERTGLDPLAVDDVIMGCLDTMGPSRRYCTNCMARRRYARVSSRRNG